MKISNTPAGMVFQIGAGPGDPELLTIKAARVLGECDVLQVDDLADSAVLVYARADARIMRASKRGGCRSTPQAFIERLMRLRHPERHPHVTAQRGVPPGRSGVARHRRRSAQPGHHRGGRGRQPGRR